MTVATFAVLTLTAGVAAADTDHVTRTFQLVAGGELRLNSFSGRVRITPSDTSQVVVDALRHGTRSQLDNIKLDIRQEGSRIIIEANQRENTWLSWWRGNQIVATDFEIKVPRRTDLFVHVFSSPVEITGIQGDHTVRTFSSSVRLDDVSGRIDVHTFSGGVDVRTRTWADAQAIDVDTFSGSVDLRVPETARGTAEFRSFSGRLTSALPLLLRSTSRRDVKAELGGTGPAGHIRVKTFSGNLRIDR